MQKAKIQNGREKQREVKLVNALSVAEVRQIEDSPDCLGKYVALFLAYTGLRVSEALSLNLKDVTGDYVSVTGKGNKQRTVPLSAKAKIMINKLVEYGSRYRETEPDRALFVSQKGSRLSRYAAFNLVKRFENAEKPVRVSPHTMRHTFATKALQNGVNVKHVSTALGHSSVAITLDIYCHSTLEDLNFVDNLFEDEQQRQPKT